MNENRFRRIRPARILCVLLALFIITGCSSGITERENAPAVSYSPAASPLNSAGTAAPEETAFLLAFSSVKSAHSAEEAMQRVMAILESKDIGYQWSYRDFVYYQHEKIPAQWIYAVNEYHEFLDVIIMDDTDVLEAIVYSFDEIEQYMNLRNNEGMSLLNSFSKPLDGVLCAGVSYTRSDDGTFGIMTAGYPFAIKDIEGEGGWDVYSARDRKYVKSNLCSREETLVPEDQLPPPVEGMYVFEPEDSALKAKESILSRLRAADPSYRIEEHDSIEIDGQEYAAEWLFAINDAGEYIDVVITEDTELLYDLHDHQDMFWDLRSKEREGLYTAQPDRKKYDPVENQWLLVDLFYKGYGIYLYGCGCPSFDCGMTAPVNDWCEELGRPTSFYSRQWIWGLNVTRED